MFVRYDYKLKLQSLQSSSDNVKEREVKNLPKKYEISHFALVSKYLLPHTISTIHKVQTTQQMMMMMICCSCFDVFFVYKVYIFCFHFT